MINSFVKSFTNPEFSYDVTITTISILISLVFAFFAWLIKDAYEKWLFETKLLLKIEVYLIRDRATLLSNQEKFSEWVSALKDNRAYSYAFQNYRLDNIEFFEVSNLDLLNRLNRLSYQLAGFESDISNTFTDYKQALERFFNQAEVEQKYWQQFNQNLRSQLEVIKGNYTDAISDINEALALLRAYKKQKLFSVFTLIKKISRPFSQLPFHSVETERKELQK
jgi:hypothetical protein